MHGLLQPVWHRLKRTTSVKTALFPIVFPIALLVGACSAIPPQPSSSPATSGIAPARTELSPRQTLSAITAQQNRLYRVAAPLLVSNVTLCKGNARRLIGFSAKNKYSFSDDYVDAAQSLGFDERLQVVGVLLNSGAARVGIKPGDILSKVEGQAMPQGQNAERQAAALLGPLVGTRSTVKLELLRNGASTAYSVPLTMACAFGIELGNADIVNAYADGQRVLVTRGMLNFVQNDTELAYVLAKELAHNALSHPARQRMSATVGGIIDNLIRINPDLGMLNGSGGIKALPQDFDSAADTLALYMLARAGYSIDGAKSFWQRLATQYPASVPNGYTAIHPSTPERLLTIEKAVVVIKAKQAAKKPLLP